MLGALVRRFVNYIHKLLIDDDFQVILNFRGCDRRRGVRRISLQGKAEFSCRDRSHMVGTIGGRLFKLVRDSRVRLFMQSKLLSTISVMTM